MYYFNQAAGGLSHDSVIAAITQHLQAEQTIGSYRAAHAAQAQLQTLYRHIADLLHCAPSEIALTTGNSHGWNSVVASFPWQPGDKVLVTPGEWGGNLAMLQQLERRHGIEVITLPNHAQGGFDLAALQQRLQADPRIRMLCLTWLPANGSCLYPAAAIGALCAQYGVVYVVDAAQAVGHLPVDVQALQCDALSAPGRKWLCGPRGTGLLYVHPRLLAQLQPVTVDHRSCPIGSQGAQLRTDTLVLESSEHSFALRMGLKAALEQALTAGWPARWQAIAHQAQQLRQGLQAMPHVQLHDADDSVATCGIVCFSVAGLDATAVQAQLQAQGVDIAVHAPPFTPLDSQARQLPSVARAAVSATTGDSDVHALLQAVRQLRPV